jgi:hypothetical protein
LHQDNALSRNTLSVKQILVSKNIAVHAHHAYLPAPCDFFLFLKIISMLKRAHFLLVQEVKAKMIKLLNSLRENNLQQFFEQWRHCMQLCLNSEGDNSEGDHKLSFKLL